MVDKDVNESDPRSNVHYLSSSEKKAWKKKFRPVWDLNPWPVWYQYRRGHRFKSCIGLSFFQAFFSQLLK